MVLKVLKSNSFVWPIISVSIVFALVFIHYLTIHDLNILPDNINYKCGYYTDKANGGNSKVLNYIASDSVISLEFDLVEGFSNPYVGISITPIKNKFIDIRKYNQIRLTLKGQGIGRLGVSIYTSPTNLSKNQKQDETLFHTFLNISNKNKSYRISIEQLESPDWWKDLHGIPTDIKFKPDLSMALHLNIGTAYTPFFNTKMSLEIYAITFTRDNFHMFIILSILVIIIIVVFFIVHYLIFLFKSKKEEITILYKPLDVQHKDELIESYLEYISNNFQKSELSLELVSNETSIPQRRITNAIHAKYNCNFKTYINKIRINESKRLLLQKNLNIGEIAFMVGFNNQSNFNRVFKNELNISPTEYRDNQKS